MHVSKSITIDQSPEKLMSILSDYHTWPIWSPWLITEPDAEVNIDEDGKHYSWNGKIVGAGEMSVTAQTQDSLDMDLLFLKPYRSKAKVKFTMKPVGESTEVTWSMDSSLPIFLFWMKKKMVAFIGNDYERGLKLLKDYAETGEVHSKLDYMGIQHFDGVKYVGIERQTTFEGMQRSMGQDFEELMTSQKGGNGTWFCMYHKFDIPNQRVHYTACVGVDSIPVEMPSHWIKGEVPACEMYTVRHQGPYDYVANAWSAASMQLRAKTFKARKGAAPMEFYRNSPQKTEPYDLVSDICFVVN